MPAQITVRVEECEPQSPHLADYIGFDPLAVRVDPRPNRQRPLLWVMDDNHPLATAQDQGVSLERMLEILAFYGHESPP